MYGKVRTVILGGKGKKKKGKDVVLKKSLIADQRTIMWPLPQIIEVNEINLKKKIMLLDNLTWKEHGTKKTHNMLTVTINVNGLETTVWRERLSD